MPQTDLGYGYVDFLSNPSEQDAQKINTLVKYSISYKSKFKIY